MYNKKLRQGAGILSSSWRQLAKFDLLSLLHETYAPQTKLLFDDCHLYFHPFVDFVVTQEEPDVPFTEEDYRRRRTHPNFSEHIKLEKLVTKLGKTVSGPLHATPECKVQYRF